MTAKCQCAVYGGWLFNQLALTHSNVGWGRPTRQATARDGTDVLVHRNELNEQQRSGGLVLVPHQYSSN